ncbi:ThuA domain-containing protein [Phragmitibacter flavus]|uniref:ThuA domain-containing protein n=1 Tax=Phragmitibacter flavus TaxID=2576071 RepID=A0A5R8K9E1_9BACT|nr:ThuA domain-containing protein [Phragmitibacter flavus]TLD68911.1 ThuA domain-containing protein [Phragmitibacter flavus]
MKKLLLSTLLLVGFSSFAHAQITFEGKDGPGKGKHVVLLAGDEEYRSEEALPMLAKLLAEHHGFTTTVLFSVNESGEVDPNKGSSLTAPENLDNADLVIMSLRFRHWPDEAMKHFDDYLKAGKPIIALRTSTHAFNITDKTSAFHYYTWNTKAEPWPGGFGKHVLGETWVAHHGAHKKEATRGIIPDTAKTNPLLNGVSDIFGTTDVYTAAPPADATILVLGQVLAGMNPTDAPVEGQKNDPLQPIAWTREFKNDAGTTNQIFTTTMGAATDLTNEGLRRLIVNAVLSFTGIEVPSKANVDVPDTYQPTMYGFDSFIKGRKPADYAK